MNLKRFWSDEPVPFSLPQCLDWGIVAAVVLACGAVLSSNVVDPDLWGHVQYGRDALYYGLARTTTYSYLAEGYPWINHEILSEYLLALANDWGGSFGMLLGKFLLGMAIIGLILHRAFKQEVKLIPASAAAILVAWTLASHWSLRPQLFSFALFTGLLAILSYCFEGWEGRWQLHLPWLRKGPHWDPADHEPLQYSSERMRHLWIVPFLIVIWTNTHGAFLAGLCVYLAYLGLRTLEVYTHRGREADGLARRFGLMAGAAVLATLLNPYGLSFHWWLVQDLIVPRPEITEWRAPNLLSLANLPFVLMLAAWLGCLFATRRSRDFTQQAILALIVWQSLMHTRHIAFFAIAFGWWMPVHLDSLFERLGLGKRFQSDEERLYGWAPPTDPAFTASLSSHMQHVFGLLLLFALTVGGGQIIYRLTFLRVERDKYPADAFYFIAQQKLTGKMVCTFNWSQYAIAAFGPRKPGDPGILVQIDGRCRTSYSQEMLDMHFDFLLGRIDPSLRYRSPSSGPLDPARSLHVGRPDLVLLSRRQQPSAALMETQKDHWSLLYQDEIAQLWGRKAKYDDPKSAFYLNPKYRIVSDFAPRGFLSWPALPDYRPEPVHALATSTP
jgi:hypothetical protein